MPYSHIGSAARAAASAIAQASTAQKNAALVALTQQLDASRALILQANTTDMAAARAAHVEPALLDRLELTTARIEAMIAGVHEIIALPDPIGAIDQLRRRPSGIEIGLMRQPLGVIGIIFESRPNVTVDAASLCLKSGNASILRGGREAFASNQALSQCIQVALRTVGLPETTVQVAPHRRS